ncbi:hypothetical protein LQZ44_15455 [Alcaligenes nematophilus]|uniref:hypothetical protein n=1 Tax=Alcaligenes nematophilus TaxID=2994643 RepID=UPI0035B53AA2
MLTRSSIRDEYGILLFFFYGIIFLPGALISLFPSIQTNFFGVLIVCSLTAIYYLLSYRGTPPINLGFLTCSLVLSAAILLHLTTTQLIFGDLEISGGWKSIFSVISLLLIAVTCGFVADSISRLSEECLLNLISGIFYWLVLLGFTVSISIALKLQDSKSMLFFTEPSHYALVASLFFCCKGLANRRSALWFIPLIVIGIFIENITLIAGILFALILIFADRRSIVLLPLIFALAASALFLTSAEKSYYFISRLNISPESDNTSVLTLLSGYEQAIIALRETWGLGYGFQRMGYINPRGEIVDVIASYRLGDASSNLHDGGTFLAKLVVEFGGFGILFFLLTIVAFFFFLRTKDLKHIFYCSICYVSILYFLLRGSGYFTSYPVLLLIALASLKPSSIKN